MHLVVRVQKCEGLAVADDEKGSSSPFVRVSYLPAKAEPIFFLRHQVVHWVVCEGCAPYFGSSAHSSMGSMVISISMRTLLVCQVLFLVDVHCCSVSAAA